MKNNIHECLDTIEYVCQQHGLNSLIIPLQCVKKYIDELERKNRGLRTTNDHQAEKIEKIGGYASSCVGRTRRRRT